jgi:hypothetical protein
MDETPPTPDTHTPTSPAQIVGFPADTAGMLSLAFEIGLCNVTA